MNSLQKIMGHRNFKTLFTTIGLMYATHINAKAVEAVTKRHFAKFDREALYQSNISHERKAKIDRQFDRFNGSHRKLTAFIKKRLRAPESYEHIITRYSDQNSHLQIIMTFRASNWSGECFVETVSAEFSLDGALLCWHRVADFCMPSSMSLA